MVEQTRLDDPKKAIGILMEEYKTLRVETLDAIKNKVSIANFTFTALTFGGSVILSSGATALVKALSLAFVVPLLTKSVAHI